MVRLTKKIIHIYKLTHFSQAMLCCLLFFIFNIQSSFAMDAKEVDDSFPYDNFIKKNRLTTNKSFKDKTSYLNDFKKKFSFAYKHKKIPSKPTLKREKIEITKLAQMENNDFKNNVIKKTETEIKKKVEAKSETIEKNTLKIKAKTKTKCKTIKAEKTQKEDYIKKLSHQRNLATPNFRTLPLPYVIKHTLSQNPRILQSIAEKMAAEHLIFTAFAEFLPYATISYKRGKEKSNNITTNHQDLTLTRHEFDVDIIQQIFSGLSSVYRYKQKKAQADLSKYSAEDIKNTITIQAIQTYLEILRLKQLRRLYIANINAHKNLLCKVEEKFVSGAGNKAEVNLASSRLDHNYSNFNQLKLALAEAKSRFIEIVGLEPINLRQPHSPDLPQNLNFAIEEATRSNPKLLAAKFDLEAAKAGYNSTKGNFFPSLNLRFGRNSSKNLDGSRHSTNDIRIMFELSYNLFAGGSDWARTKSAGETKVAAKYKYNSTKRNLITNVTSMWNNIQTDKAQLQKLKSYENSTKDVLRDYYLQFSLGRRSLLDLLNMENEVFGAKVQVVNEKFSIILNSFALLATTGKLVNYFDN